jgi:hypothetical protein
MSTDWFDRGLNPYEILGLGEDAQQATPDEIKKAILDNCTTSCFLN